MRHSYYDLDEYSTANTIIGHDNTDLPPKTHDPEWTYLTAGRLQLGDFSTAESVSAAGPESEPSEPLSLSFRAAVLALSVS